MQVFVYTVGPTWYIIWCPVIVRVPADGSRKCGPISAVSFNSCIVVCHSPFTLDPRPEASRPGHWPTPRAHRTASSTQPAVRMYSTAGGREVSRSGAEKNRSDRQIKRWWRLNPPKQSTRTNRRSQHVLRRAR